MWAIPSTRCAFSMKRKWMNWPSLILMPAVENSAPDISRIEEIVSEAFMPIAYGGGITTVDQVKRILSVGVEKVILNRSAVKNPALITEIAKQFGSQSVVVSIDYKKNFFGKLGVYIENGKTNTGLDPLTVCKTNGRSGCRRNIAEFDRQGWQFFGV